MSNGNNPSSQKHEIFLTPVSGSELVLLHPGTLVCHIQDYSSYIHLKEACFLLRPLPSSEGEEFRKSHVGLINSSKTDCWYAFSCLSTPSWVSRIISKHSLLSNIKIRHKHFHKKIKVFLKNDSKCEME